MFEWIRNAISSMTQPSYDHGLTPVQLARKKEEIKECKAQGKQPSNCEKCNRKALYMYHSFPKRGGTKYLYCCDHCFYTTSNLVVSEEDYDFLAN